MPEQDWLLGFILSLCLITVEVGYWAYCISRDYNTADRAFHLPIAALVNR